MSHFFLVFEGLDGSGKSAICTRLAAHLAARCGTERVLHSFEPHDPSAAGGFIRDALAKRIATSTRTLALAFALNRMDHNERVITPFLQSGDERIVLCDRYILSSLVYQGMAGADLSIEAVAALNVGVRMPDLTLFLDATPEVCYARMGSRGGTRELYEERLTDIRARYHHAIDWMRDHGSAITAIDADPDMETVFASVLDALRSAPAWLHG